MKELQVEVVSYQYQETGLHLKKIAMKRQFGEMRATQVITLFKHKNKRKSLSQDNNNLN